TRRAGAAVGDALRRLGAHDLVLDLSADPQWRKTAADRLVDGLNPPVPETPEEVGEQREELREARKVLGDFIGALHLPRTPRGVGRAARGARRAAHGPGAFLGAPARPRGPWGGSAHPVPAAPPPPPSPRPGPGTPVRPPSTTVRELSEDDQRHARNLLIE